ncbi:LysR family transcriptional regulator [Ammoniphilus sp. CFH 90114]|uniref:LysR family transcriptional regulator n=1 Tax=Ammoniphilus sp. CFH 90114 TaxID=2493665 RepID=UPI00100E58D3|nr:LysR family transcriptional regulator [Ammoniphilus sp. CFH 90114]RXT07252.1 LysR family transcriptional regulator [Ammoniphilus sp. CFH 90114]
MELRHLEYFYKVGKHKNFTHAAHALHVSQPTVTNAVNQLEEELGVKLLIRNTKNVSLTHHGELFHKRVESILGEIQSSIEEVKDRLSKIKMGLPPMIGARIFPSVYKEFKHCFPAIDIEVMEKGSVSTCELLETGELDLGLIILPEDQSSLNVIPLMEEEIMVCMHPDHALAKNKEICFSQLKDEDFVALTPDFLHRKLTLKECEKHGFTPRIVFESHEVSTAKELVANGLGISLFMKLIVAKRSDIVQIPLSNQTKVQIGLAWKKNKHLTKNCKQFIDFAEAYFTQL